MMSYGMKALLCSVLLFVVSLVVLGIIILIRNYKLRRWIRALVKYGQIIPVDAEEFTRMSVDIHSILSDLYAAGECELDEFFERVDKYGFEATIIVISLMADQYKQFMSPLTIKFIGDVLDLTRENISMEEVQHWDLGLPAIQALNAYAEGYAQNWLYLPEKMEKKTMNPIHKWIVREEARKQKEYARIEARLSRNHNRY